MERIHRSILVNEVLDLLKPSPMGTYADMTFGEGGHTASLLGAGAGRVVSIDRDPEALARFRAEGSFREDPRLELHHARMSEFAEVAAGRQFDGIVVDLGPSTRQLTDAHRGFSFSNSGPIDMRMDQTAEGSLAEKLAEVDAESLAQFLRDYADVHPARRVAEKLLALNARGELQSTEQLAKVMGPKRGKRNPATTLFAALRIWVNDEMGEIERGFPHLIDLLKPGGRLAVITFHSTEDRLVKQLFKRLAGRCTCDEYICRCKQTPIVDLTLRKALPPSDEELKTNPRARSAKLRCVEKIAPAQ